MIGWFLESIWQAALGLALLLGVLVGATFVLGRAIAAGQFTDHDANRCQCPACTQRRVNSWDRQQVRNQARNEAEVVRSRTKKNGWRSTVELRTADRIQAKGGFYEVTSLIHMTGVGVQVHLNNLGTGKRSMVLVRNAKLAVRIWQVAD